MRIVQLLQASKNADSLLLQKWQRGTLRAEKADDIKLPAAPRLSGVLQRLVPHASSGSSLNSSGAHLVISRDDLDHVVRPQGELHLARRSQPRTLSMPGCTEKPCASETRRRTAS